MSKVRSFAEITPNLPFTECDFYDLYRTTFENTELGRMKTVLPLHEMLRNYGLTHESLQPKRGRKSYFTPEGKVALMFLKMHRRLFGVDVKKIGGDTSYAGTVNRDLCKKNGIQTSFVKREKSSKDKTKDVVRREFARVRATAMEGSFGTQKEHYSMRMIKARKKATELLYIFFGIHTANVVQLAGWLPDLQLAAG